MRLLYPRVYERIDDKVDINYIHNLERRFFPRKIFKVNDYLTLKLEDNRTFIYIKGKKFLLLDIPITSTTDYNEIESLDEAAEKLDRSMEKGPRIYRLSPDIEFWGHCSNIQAWADHEYDTRLLPSNLSFPLLKALSDAGDPKAKAIFEEEIAIRLESGYPSVVNYLLGRGYLRYLDKDRLKTLLENYADVEMYCGICGTELPDPNQQSCPNCGIPLRYLNMINSLKREFDIIAGAVIKGRQITYTTDNWDISGDVDNLLSSWFGHNTQFIMLSGVKYSILQMESERLVAISLKGEGSICAAKDDDSIIILQVKKYDG